MPKKIDTAGTYLGTIVESALGMTKKGYPQGIWRLKADKKYIEAPSEVEHYTKQEVLKGEAGYVDYASFDEEALGYLVLFNSAESFVTEGEGKTSLMNYEQIQIATGWTGAEFDSFNNGFFVGKQVLFRVDEDIYDNKQTFKVNWVDAPDASPVRQLKALDADKVKALNSKLVIVKGVAKPAAAKPAAAKPAAPKPMTTTPAAATPAPQAAAPPAPTAAKPPPGKRPKAPETTASGQPAECSQADAWAYVIENKGDNEDQVVEEAWVSITSEVGGSKNEAEITPAEWAKVRDLVLKDLAA